MTSQPYGLFRNESVTRLNQGELSPVRKSPSDQVNTSLVFFFFVAFYDVNFFFNVRVHSLRTDQMTLKETHIGLGIHQDYLLVYQFAFDQMWNNALQTIKNEKSKDYCKADSEQRVLFFITIFRLAVPAFFRFTDVSTDDIRYSYILEGLVCSRAIINYNFLRH